MNGKPLSGPEEYVYILLNKPTGYVSTVKDRHARHTIMELVKGAPGRLYPVGRLDVDSAGLLLLTNDGELTELLTHPSHQVPKTYRAVVRAEVTSFTATDLRHGIMLEDGMTAPAEVEIVEYQRYHNITILDITIHEGRNRQIRRMMDAVGHPVLALTRTRIGALSLKGLAPGTWRNLHSSELKKLRAEADSRPQSLPMVAATESEPPPERREKNRKPDRLDRQKPSTQVSRKEAARTQTVAASASAPGHLAPDSVRLAARALSEQLGRDRNPDETEPARKGGKKKAPSQSRGGR